MTTMPFLLLALSPFVIFDSDYALISCLLCKSNTLWNIFMTPGRNVEQEETTCCRRMTTLPFLLFEIYAFVLLEIDFMSSLKLKNPLDNE